MTVTTKNTTTFSAPDIHCEGCARSIGKALAKIDGVSGVSVDIAAKTVVVEHDASTADIAAALERVGFPATTEG